MPFDRKTWEKANTELISVRLQKSTDADILSYLDGKSKQGEIKSALRERIKRTKARKATAAKDMREKLLSAPGQKRKTKAYLYWIDERGQLCRQQHNSDAVEIMD